MAATKVNTISLEEIFAELISFLNFMWQKRKLFLLLAVAGMAVSTTYYFFQKPKYEAISTFILETKEPSGGGLAGLASQFGFDISSMSGSSNLFGGDNILDIIKSKFIIEKVLLTSVDNVSKRSNQTLADLFIKFSGLQKKIGNETAVIDLFSEMKNSNHFLRDSILEVIYTRIIDQHLKVELISKKGSILKVSTTSPNSIFSKCFTERLIEETKKFYIDVKTRNATNNIKALGMRSDSLFRIINEKSGQSATLQIADLNPAIKIAEVPVEISQRGKMVALALYTEVMKNLEASRMGLANQTPVIQILDTPKYPLVDKNKSFFLLGLLGIAAGFLFGFLICFFTFSPRHSN